jgi:aspartate 1-decarboxylase
MKLRQWVGGKIHGLRVTGKGLGYNGSATLPKDLMTRAGIQPYEAIWILNKATGARFMTYALPGRPGSSFELNGAAARLGEVGDECLVVTFVQAEEFPGADVVFCDEHNLMTHVMSYTPDDEDLGGFPHPDEDVSLVDLADLHAHLRGDGDAPRA